MSSASPQAVKKLTAVSTSPSSSSSSIPLHVNVSDIQWSMIDKNKYFPLTTANMITIRTLLYPLTLVRTRLQVQARGSLYTGTLHALQTVVKYEGFLGLYKGYWINSFQLVPHVLYITSYEVSKQWLFSNRVVVANFFKFLNKYCKLFGFRNKLLY